MRPILALLVLLVVLAGAAFYWLRQEASAPITATAGDPATTTAGERSAEELASVRNPGDEAGSRASEDSRISIQAQQPSTTPKAPQPALTGRVLDAGGKAVALAQVLIAPGPSFGRMPIDSQGPFQDGQRNRKETQTDDQGRFRFEGVAAGPLRLAVRAGGYAPLDRFDLSVPAGGAHDLGELTLELGVVLSGRVVDAVHRGVGGASVLRVPARDSSGLVFLGGRPSAVPVATTAADGSFLVDQLAAGPWKLLVTSEDHPDQVAEGAVHKPGAREDGLTIRLEPGASITGRVVGAPSGVEGKLFVQAWPQVVAKLQGGQDEERPSHFESREAKVAVDGSFEVRGLRLDPVYNLSAGRRLGDQPWLEGLSPAVSASAGDRGVEITFEPDSALVFQVVDGQSGEPIQELDISAGAPWPIPYRDEQGRVQRRFPDGRVRFGGLRPDLADAKAELEIRAVGYHDWKQEGIALASGVDTPLGVIRMERAPVLTVRVHDKASGQPIAGASVKLSVVEPEGEHTMRAFIAVGADGQDEPEFSMGESRQARTDAEGVARLTLYAGQSSRLEVRHRDHAPAHAGPFTIAAGKSEERAIELGAGGSVVVRLIDGRSKEPLAGGRVEHQSAQGAGEELHIPGHGTPPAITDTGGEARFDHLEPGLHYFRPTQPGPGEGVFFGDHFALSFGPDGQGAPRDSSWFEVTVVESQTEEVTLTTPILAALYGIVREAGVELAGANVSLASKREDEQELPGAFMFGGGPRTQSDARGEYRLADVKAGEYSLTVTHPRRSMPWETTVRIELDDLRLNLDLPLAILEGRVVDDQGKGVGNAEIWAERPRQSGEPRRMIMSSIGINTGGATSISFGDGADSPRVRTDGEGRYQLRGVVSDVDLVVKAEGQGLQPGQSDVVRVAEGQTRTGVDFALSPGGSIEVTVLGSDGQPRGEALCLARFQGESPTPPEPKTEIVGENGKLTLDGLMPGPWSLSVRKFGEGGPLRLGDQPGQTVVVKPRETTRISIPID